MRKIIIAAVLLAAAGFAAYIIYVICTDYPRDKTGMVNPFRYVYYDDNYFTTSDGETAYLPGSEVKVIFTQPHENVEYEFDVTGVENIGVGTDAQQRYVISFAMPDEDVSIDYRVAEPFAGISISLDENPTTGYQWQYEIDPENILEPVEDRYVSDTYEGDEPISGLGGTHYWKFLVTGEGEAAIRFVYSRGEAASNDEQIIYRYICNGETAELEEEIMTDEMEIESLAVRWSGGYTTRAGAQPVSIVFEGSQVSLRTELDAYEGKESTKLVQNVEVDEAELKELYAYVKENLWDIQHGYISQTEIMDAGFQFITINGTQCGGYAINGEAFNEVFSRARKIVTEEQIDAFYGSIYDWFGEERW